MKPHSTHYIEQGLEEDRKSRILTPLIVIDVLSGLVLLAALIFISVFVIQLIAALIFAMAVFSTVNAFFEILQVDPRLLRFEEHIRHMKRLEVGAYRGDEHHTVAEMAEAEVVALDETENPEIPDPDGQIGESFAEEI